MRLFYTSSANICRVASDHLRGNDYRDVGTPIASFYLFEPAHSARLATGQKAIEMKAVVRDAPVHKPNLGTDPGDRYPKLALAIMGLGLTQIIGWGTIFYPVAVVAQAMGQAIGKSREAVFWGITIVMLGSAITSPRIGMLIDRIGARQPLAVGSIATAVGLLLLSIATGL